MKYKVTKIDKRHRGAAEYKYFIEPERYYPWIPARENIHNWRAWCWETWGASSELKYEPAGSKWTWDTNSFKTRIYLRTEKELTMFHLRWAQG